MYCISWKRERDGERRLSRVLTGTYLKYALEIVGKFEALTAFRDETDEILPVHLDVLLSCFDCRVVVVVFRFEFVGDGHDVLKAFFESGDIRLNGLLLLECGFDGRQIRSELITEETTRSLPWMEANSSECNTALGTSVQSNMNLTMATVVITFEPFVFLRCLLLGHNGSSLFMADMMVHIGV